MRGASCLCGIVILLALVGLPASAAITITNPSFEAYESFTEPNLIVMTGTNRVNLTHSTVIPESVVVTSEDGSITYVHGTSANNGDYRIWHGQAIERTNTSTIPSGTGVRVSYDYSIWEGWTKYGFTIPGEGGAPTEPWIGTIGGESVFDVLYPNQGSIDGRVCCGFQGWTDARNGGVFQTVTADGPGFLVIKARSFSLLPYNFQPWDNGTRVRAYLAPGVLTARPTEAEVPAQMWTSVPWGEAWTNLVLPVPAAGQYTLFVESHTPWSNGIYSSIWDWIKWSDGVVTITNGPVVTSVGETTATIEWDTDVLSNTVLGYDANGAPYENTVSLNNGTNPNTDPYVLHHVVNLTGLTPGTQYYFQAQSHGPGLDEALSGAMMFTTVASVQPTLANFDFEAVDSNNNPTLVPWSTFGVFDGIFPSLTNGNTYGVPPHGGEHFAGAIASYGNHKDQSGIFQRVNVTPGGFYAASAYIYTENWLEQQGNPGVIVPGPGYDTQCRIGIDPTGAYDPSSSDIIWSDWDNSQDWQAPFNQLGYKQIAVLAQIPPTSNIATVFLQVRHAWPNAWVKTAFDDVALVEAQPCADLNCIGQQPVGWMVDANNGGNGYLVTKVEDFNESTGTYRYCWVQSDDRSAAYKVRITDTTTITPSGAEVLRGCRIGLKGRTVRHSIKEFNWAETEIQADTINIISTDNGDPAPLAVTNAALCGGTMGIQRGATGAVGVNNTARVVRTTGWVKETSPGSQPSWFVIDDGSNVPCPGTMTGLGIKVFLYDQFSFPPAENSFVTVTGVAYLDVFDPTPEFDVPNGNGDEVLIRSIRTRDYADIQTLISP